MVSQDTKNISDLLTYTRILLNEGDHRMASHSACMAFEAILPKVRPRKGESQYEIAIQQYYRYNNHDDRILNLLNDSRKIRNKIVHDHVYSGCERLYENLCEVVCFDPNKRVAEMDFEDITRFKKRLSSNNEDTASVYHNRYFDGFNDEDFRNLHEMRNKFSQLKGVLERSLFNLKIPISFDAVSKPNSAYVWLAAVNDVAAERPKIDKPSLSVLATNNDFRVYLH